MAEQVSRGGGNTITGNGVERESGGQATVPDSMAPLRQLFPILNQTVRGVPLAYFDNAATTQKPVGVIEAVKRYYERDNANVHRAAHDLAGRATLGFESARTKVAQFINARSDREIIFTRGTTESLNLIAYSYGALAVGAGDDILLTELEHHSNIVPWQLLAQRTGAKVVAAPLSDRGDIIIDQFRERLTTRTKIVSFTHVSNALGTMNPVAELVSLVRRYAPQAIIVIDGAQWVAHGPTDVQALDVDFYCFSAHKLFGPTGVGVLWGKYELLERMPPFLGGGDMIDRVSFRETTFAKPPSRFEAGTPHIAGVIGLGAAIEFLGRAPWPEVVAHEKAIAEQVLEGLRGIDGVRLIGAPAQRISVASFRVDGVAPIDVAVMVNNHGVALRAGHHCCMPLMERLGVSGTVRASWCLYTSQSDVESLIAAVRSTTQRRSIKRLAKVEERAVIPGAERSASSVAAAAAALIAEFDGCPDAAMKQELLFEWGQSHRNLLERLKECTTPVPGCMSEVRVLLRHTPDGELTMASDANAGIVRGLLTVIERLVSGQQIAELREFNIRAFLVRIGIDQFLSMQRRNGLEGVLQMIEEEVKAIGEGIV